MHPADLVVGGYELKVGVVLEQFRRLQLGVDVLGDQLDGNHVGVGTGRGEGGWGWEWVWEWG